MQYETPPMAINGIWTPAGVFFWICSGESLRFCCWWEDMLSGLSSFAVLCCWDHSWVFWARGPSRLIWWGVDGSGHFNLRIDRGRPVIKWLPVFGLYFRLVFLVCPSSQRLSHEMAYSTNNLSIPFRFDCGWTKFFWHQVCIFYTTFCRQNEPALASQSFLEVFLLPTHFERCAISRFRGAGLTIWAYFLCCENTCGIHKLHIFYKRPISHDSFTKLCTLMVRWSRV